MVEPHIRPNDGHFPRRYLRLLLLGPRQQAN